jgi:hypothetical protein
VCAQRIRVCCSRFSDYVLHELQGHSIIDKKKLKSLKNQIIKKNHYKNTPLSRKSCAWDLPISCRSPRTTYLDT